MKRILAGIALAAASLLAYADGPQYQYEQAAVNQAALDPNEALVNDDGAVEEPNAKMSTTARAYRNGYYNGKNAQREQDANVKLPPLPTGPYSAPRSVAEDDQSRYTSIPPQPVQAPPIRATRPSYLQQEGPVPGGYPPPPVNVYVQAPQPQYYEPPVYAPRPEPFYTQPEPEYYEPPPPRAYVIIRGIPPTFATGYWPRYAARPHYYPHYYRPY